MSKKSISLYPNQAAQMAAFGDRIRLARQRRKLTTTLFAERMGVSRETLRRVENGDSAVAFGTYLSGLQALGMSQDVDSLASNDVLGQKLQDAALVKQQRKSLPSKDSQSAHPIPDDQTVNAAQPSLINQVLAKYKAKTAAPDKE
jgi:transcriptional regulator with XRE-family HTH domain